MLWHASAGGDPSGPCGRSDASPTGRHTYHVRVSPRSALVRPCNRSSSASASAARASAACRLQFHLSGCGFTCRASASVRRAACASAGVSKRSPVAGLTTCNCPSCSRSSKLSAWLTSCPWSPGARARIRPAATGSLAAVAADTRLADHTENTPAPPAWRRVPAWCPDLPGAIRVR